MFQLFTDADGSGGRGSAQNEQRKNEDGSQLFHFKSPYFNYLPMPMEAAGAAALRMNSAKMRMVVSFFISNLLFFQSLVNLDFPL
ncbi:MAG: hypothetical protein HPY72_10220 [Anaerolineae bacterium]|nr:hypothetical protein [Anaerolineae bacterium]